MNKNNLTWLYEGDAWFQSIVMFATATKMREGDTIPEFGSMEELDKWLLADYDTLESEREAKLIRAMEDVLRHATDTVWVSETETLVDRMVSLGVYGCEVYEGARLWEVG